MFGTVATPPTPLPPKKMGGGGGYIPTSPNYAKLYIMCVYINGLAFIDPIS